MIAEPRRPAKGGRMGIRTSDQLRYWARDLNHGLFDTATLRHRQLDGVLASMQQSGTHWVRHMLSLTLAKLHDLPPPAHIKDHSIVGKLQSPPVYLKTPQIRYTDSSPHYLLRSRTLFRFLHFPKYLILVRDLRDALVSHYEKKTRMGRYDVDFSTYLRGDSLGKTYRPNIWSRIRFMDGWGTVAERQPERVAVLKYEDFVADPSGRLARLCGHFNIEGTTPDVLDEVVAAASKAEMRKLPNPKGKSFVVRTDPRPADEWYSDEDRRFVAEVCRRHLKYTFGYQYW